MTQAGSLLAVEKPFLVWAVLPPRGHCGKLWGCPLAVLVTEEGYWPLEGMRLDGPQCPGLDCTVALPRPM